MITLLYNILLTTEGLIFDFTCLSRWIFCSYVKVCSNRKWSEFDGQCTNYTVFSCKLARNRRTDHGVWQCVFVFSSASDLSQNPLTSGLSVFPPVSVPSPPISVRLSSCFIKLWDKHKFVEKFKLSNSLSIDLALCMMPSPIPSLSHFILELTAFILPITCIMNAQCQTSTESNILEAIWLNNLWLESEVPLDLIRLPHYHPAGLSSLSNLSTGN